MLYLILLSFFFVTRPLPTPCPRTLGRFCATHACPPPPCNRRQFCFPVYCDSGHMVLRGFYLRRKRTRRRRLKLLSAKNFIFGTLFIPLLNLLTKSSLHCRRCAQLPQLTALPSRPLDEAPLVALPAPTALLRATSTPPLPHHRPPQPFRAAGGSSVAARRHLPGGDDEKKKVA
jgi:hypothetical protein